MDHESSPSGSATLFQRRPLGGTHTKSNPGRAGQAPIFEFPNRKPKSPRRPNRRNETIAARASDGEETSAERAAERLGLVGDARANA